jgi:ABC-type Fe3+-hydroxamate transport system substrate-binding protein
MNRSFEDQTKRLVEFEFPPKRIISLVPSLTELLFDLGLNEEVIGITKFCIRPNHWYREKTRIGGTKTVNLELIEKLQPDLIIANKEENDQQQIEALTARYPVWISDVRDLKAALQMIHAVSAITDRENQGAEMVRSIEDRFKKIEQNANKKTAIYLIWNSPLMSINHDTFIHDMMERCGLQNMLASRTDSRYPIISDEEMLSLNPDYLMLSSEPFPFQEKHLLEFQTRFPNIKVVLADGENFSWYGSRLLHFTSPSL